MSDFIGADELAQLTGFTVKTIYHQHCTRRGALVPILSKLGRRLGAWREDYETWRAKQLKLTKEDA
jgi:predicted DNA-binding transcriptional regulator AlpA